MMISEKRPHYIVALGPERANSSLLMEDGSLRKDLRRSIDYRIISAEDWEREQDRHDREIVTMDVYNLYLTFCCNGETRKNILVHGVEKVFEAVLTLFINRGIDIESFRRMFVVKCKETDRLVDPAVSFSELCNELGEGTESVNLTIKRADCASKCCRHGQCIGGSYGKSHALHDENNNAVHRLDGKSDCRLGSGPIGSSGVVSPERSPYLYIRKTPNGKCTGLPNLGNTCYMNSALQCINSCDEFLCFFDEFLLNSLTEEAHASHHPQAGRKTAAWKVVAEWIRLMLALQNGECASALRLKNALGEVSAIYRGYEEQDSHEFINYLMDTIHEETKCRVGADGQCLNGPCPNGEQCIDRNGWERVPFPVEVIGEQHREIVVERRREGRSSGPEDSLHQHIKSSWRSFLLKNNSVVAHYFYGMIATTLCCSVCGHTRHKSDPFLSLSLPIPPEIKYHPSILLIFEEREPLRACVPSAVTAGQLVELLRRNHKVASELLVLGYSSKTIKKVLDGDEPISGWADIRVYEYRSDRRYFMATISFRKYLLFSERVNIDILVAYGDMSAPASAGDIPVIPSLYSRLHNYLASPSLVTLQIFSENLNIQETGWNPVLKIPTAHVLFTNVDGIINLKVLRNVTAEHRSGPSLYDCLSLFLKSETVNYHCEECRRNTPHVLTPGLSFLPKYLVIQLKRFTYFSSESKIDSMVDFPVDNFTLGSASYRLIGSCNHMEIGMGFGHYMAYVRRDSKWYCCNDSVVSKATEIDKVRAYILFYERM